MSGRACVGYCCATPTHPFPPHSPLTPLPHIDSVAVHWGWRAAALLLFECRWCKLTRSPHILCPVSTKTRTQVHSSTKADDALAASRDEFWALQASEAPTRGASPRSILFHESMHATCA
jgi:hypothetical protein